ncbi:MAG: fused MFS/spermidine synthase [Thermoanaerobaculia bacterium]
MTEMNENSARAATSADSARETGRNGRHLLAWLFLASGAAGLIDQVAWLRYLSLVFGNTTLATATLLAVFMAGLGLGAFLFGRIADRTRRPLTIYALLEAGIGLFAMFSPRFFAGMTEVYVAVDRSTNHSGSAPWSFLLLRVALVALCLLPPTILMGGTLPLVVRSLFRGRAVAGAASSTAGPGRDVALLYGANTLGAVLGVAGAGFVTIPLVGLHATLLLSAALNFAAALGALALARSFPRIATDASANFAPAGEPLHDASKRHLLVAAALMGATSLAFEVLWTRILLFYLGSSVYAFSLMLLGFLLGVAIGSFAIARVVDRLDRPLALLAGVELGIAATAPLSIWLFATLNGRQLALSETLHPQGFGVAMLAQLLAVLPVVLPPTLLMGVSFPLLVRIYTDRRGQGSRAIIDHESVSTLGADLGALYGANTLGCIAGSLGAGFLLIPALGTQRSLLFVGAICAGIAWLFVRGAGAPTEAGSSAGIDGAKRFRRGVTALAIATPLLFLGLDALLPANRVILAAGIFGQDRPGDLVHFHEDASAAVAIRKKSEAAGPYLSLELNGVNVAGTSPDLYAVQKLQGHLPMLLGDSRNARVVHIGFGSGGTAYAVSRHPVSEIRIVEISPAVLAASSRYFADINHGVLADPRVHVQINDGRNFLLATTEVFDAVLSDSIHPRYAGNGSLYSEEYFRIVADRLSPDGVVSMWLPMYTLTPSNFAMIVRAFKNVFPDTVVWYEPSALNSFTVVTGRKRDGPWDPTALARGFADPAVQEALSDIGMRNPADLLACALLMGPELDAYLGATPPHVDDLPAVEYESGTLLAGDWTWLATFSQLLAHRPAEPWPAILEALPPDQKDRERELWHQRTLLLEDQRRFLASQVTPYR